MALKLELETFMSKVTMTANRVVATHIINSRRGHALVRCAVLCPFGLPSHV